jgi:hypothetical protein
VPDGLILAALVNHGAPDTIDVRALNSKHYHDPEFHPFLHESNKLIANKGADAKSRDGPQGTDRPTLEMFAMVENLTLVSESAKAVGVQIGGLRTKHLL